MKINGFDTNKSFFYENGFFLSADDRRFAKMIAHFKLYEAITNLLGDIVEFDVFKGNSFFEFAHYRNILENTYSRKIVGFDMFGEFPKTNYEGDKQKRVDFINEAGDGIALNDMESALKHKNIKNYELIKGDICQTLPKYAKQNPHQKIALLHIDTDIYEPCVCILEHCYERVMGGGNSVR